ncbi:hypothetical protein B0H13DRAFT_1906744 [Mycena leptocephala]|nr:hypothetical protein B0H13DRAFT_1906744 [Mycena leptocephala]
MAEFEKSLSEEAANDAMPPSEVPAVAQTSFPEGGTRGMADRCWRTHQWMTVFRQGYFKHLLAGGSFIYLLSSFLLSLAKPHNFYQNFLAQGVGMGIGMGILFLPCISIPAHYFKRRRGLAMGIILSGSSVGAVCYPIMVNHLFNGKTGFAWGVRAVSFLDLGLLLTANVMMRTRLPPHSVEVQWSVIMRDVPYWFCLIG